MSHMKWLRPRGRLLRRLIAVWLGLTISVLSSFNPALAFTPSEVVDSSHRLGQAERLGRTFYTNGQFSEAIIQWRLVADAYERQQNILAQVNALSNLSLSYQGLGQWNLAQAAITQGLSLITVHEASFEDESVALMKAQALMTQGSLQLSIGQTERALDSWKQAAEAYEQGNDDIGMSRAQINQAQAMRELGFYRQALENLLVVAEVMETQPASMLKAIALRRLGDALRVSGQLSAAQTALNESLLIARQQSEPAEMSATLLSLGYTARSLGELEKAEAFYADAINAIELPRALTDAVSDKFPGEPSEGPSRELSRETTTQTSLTRRLPIELAQLDLAVTMGDVPTVTDLWPVIQQKFADMSDSRHTLYQQINWATILIRYLSFSALSGNEVSSDEMASSEMADEFSAFNLPSLQVIDQQLREVIVRSRSLADRRAEAHAIGTLGHLYEFNHQWESAKQLTERALRISQEENATDIIYQWQWQLGRIWKNKARSTQPIARSSISRSSISRAIDAYSASVETLSTLRGDLIGADGSAQISFRENVEPVYRQLVSLLLQTDPEAENYQKNLNKAQSVIESLRLAELDNYFHEACVDVSEMDINKADDKAAIVYTLVLEDRLSVLLHLPNQPIQHFSMAVSAQQVEEVTQQLRQQLVILSRRQYLTSAAQLYDWLIAPARAAIDRNQIETLVFVLDGPLQNVPMATLYDGELFLEEDYSVALSPGLTLINPQPWDRSRLSALSAGVTESRQGLSSLPYVASEIEKVAATIDRHIVLLDQDFTQAALSNQLRSNLYPIVHVATHGQFGSTAEETFLLAWDALINVRDVSEILQANLGGRAGIDLLVLSACETASGDQRAAQGLSGVAIRSGARSTVGSLWSVNDEVTSKFVGYFYEHLTQPGVSRAAALRSAQLQLISDPQYQHPIHWAPYILLGSWL